MGMSTGGSGAVPKINVTPLIDVLLVLLIIFMVISPLKPHRFEAKIPAEPKDQPQVNVKANPLTLVIVIDKTTKKVTLNNEPAGDVSDASALTDKLKSIFDQRTANGVFHEGTNQVEKTVFIKSSPIVKYGDVVKVIDAARG
ncbi:MAG: ExbD/TolR family protein, partial [Pyrinomonadaceae bacterium]